MALAVALGMGSLTAQTITPYLWEFPYVNATTVIASGNATTMIARLCVEVQKTLTLGPGLSIVQFDHHDRVHDEQYWLYVKPGRDIATMAWAYPYCPALQTQMRNYVQAVLASSTFQPWAGQVAPTSGTKRELFPISTRTWSDSLYSNFPSYTPACEQMYGLWLWGWQIGGNWSDLTPYQAAIRSWYTSIASTCGLYGGMGAHIAKARLESSTIWNNSGNQTTATNNLQTAMTNGLNFANTELLVANCLPAGSTGLWRFEYCKLDGSQDTRKQNGQYLGWMFYGIAPEVARYIATENITAALTRHAAGKTKYPLWYVRQSGYDNGMAGVGADIEGSGISPEVICMIAPMERYAIGASAATMALYTRSGPYSVMDSCWMELLVSAIESNGSMSWVDTRSGHP